ncbi:MAG: hypothetical protein ACFCUJ_12740 [Thiotrichales bacterium]
MASSGGSELEQVREILFGTQAREWQQRIYHLETRLSTRIDDLESRLQQQLSDVARALEQAVKSIENTLEQQKIEQSNRVAAVKTDADRAWTELDASLRQLHTATTDSGQALKSEIEQRTHQLAVELKGEIATLSSHVTQSMDELNANKLSRSQFAGVLASLAGNITGKGD